MGLGEDRRWAEWMMEWGEGVGEMGGSGGVWLGHGWHAGYSGSWWPGGTGGGE